MRGLWKVRIGEENGCVHRKRGYPLTPQQRFTYCRTMNAYAIASVAWLIGDCARAQILVALFDKDTTPLEPLGFARTCYDHLAGKLGVAVTDTCLGRDWLRAAGKDFELTPEGERGFRTFDIDTDALKMQRRGFARQCLDWTERRYHLAGALGAALTQSFFERKWLLQNEGSRVVHLTNEGRKGLSSSLAVRL